jgi:hypothetical protein
LRQLNRGSFERLEMTVTHTPDPIVSPERLFEGLENLMPFLLRKLRLCGTLLQCHPERSVCFAKRSGCGVEGPCVTAGQDECSEAFSQGRPVEIPCDDIARFKATASFDCVVASLRMTSSRE